MYLFFKTICLIFIKDEKSDAGRTSGSYYVQLPDGRLQKVTYTVNGDEGE